jgi:hypothetical protein
MNEEQGAETLYFQKPGPRNTAACLKAAKKRADELGLESVVLASCSGSTAKQALEVFDPGRLRIIAVTHVTGFREPNVQEMDPEVREELIQKGLFVHTAAHAFGGVGRGLRQKLSTYQVDEIMAYTLRLFGQGVKVGVEMALMCADAGLVRTDREILTIAGTGQGADTALVITPANSHACLEARIHEIVAKPRHP